VYGGYGELVFTEKKWGSVDGEGRSVGRNEEVGVKQRFGSRELRRQ
jgi:hypothetical protein